MRLVTDFVQLNRYIKRPIHPFPSSNEIMKQIRPTSKCFMKLDAVNGYFQMALDEESSFFDNISLKKRTLQILERTDGPESNQQ
jgi:hypothetical protein